MSLKILREFLSLNCQYWCSLLAIKFFLACKRFHRLKDTGVLKIKFMQAKKKNMGNTVLCHTHFITNLNTGPNQPSLQFLITFNSFNI